MKSARVAASLALMLEGVGPEMSDNVEGASGGVTWDVSPGLWGSRRGNSETGSCKRVPISHRSVPAALAAGVRGADDLSELCGRGAQVPARSGR